MTGSLDIRRRLLRHPVRIVPLGLLAAIAVATALLMLPAARAGTGGASFFTALFTATSAICTTGLVITETSEYWTAFGHVIITLLTQLGGFGIITAALLTALLVSQRLGLGGRQAFAESTRFQVGHARTLLAWIALTMLVCEAVIAAFLTARLTIAYDYPLGRAAWYGVFHAVQAFNNSGFALFQGSATNFVGDAWISLPLTLGVVVGSLGFPVIFELVRHRRRPALWSIHTRLTVWGSLILLAVGFLSVLYFERDNPATLGPLAPGTKVLAAFVQGAIPRSGGLQTVDYAAMNEETLASTTILMFIGGGSASTAGGIKVTTFFLLAFVIWAELRGEPDVVIGHRRIAGATQRRALTIALLSVALVTVATLTLVAETTGLRLHRMLFEAVSAFSTAGLSVGITQQLPKAGQVVLIILMFIGRLGTIVAASALALHTRIRHYGYPEEQPIVG
ncbi:MAG TPA: potassium transporter TrkG [Micromonosporaceae bacterium]|nr:potassium transporter TrkG [Micromonosporaceae bacterium]